MEHIAFSEAKAHLSEIIDRVEAGETVTITRHGKPVAEVTKPKPMRVPFDVGVMRAVSAQIPMQRQSAADLIREMRDEGW